MHVAIDAVGIRGHGGASVLTELLNWLPVARPKWKWRVFLLDRELREFDDPPVVPTVTLERTDSGDSGIGRILWVNRILPNRLSALKADILFSFANLAPSSPRIPQVLFCHQRNVFVDEKFGTHYLKRARVWFMRRQILRGARASQAIIVQTENMRLKMLQAEPALTGRLHVIPSGYRTASGPNNIRANVRRLIESSGKPRFIYVSHPGGSKNHETLVDAMSLILRSYPTASLLLTLEIQRSMQRDYKHWVQVISKKVDRLGISSQVILTGKLNPDEIHYALRSCDLMIYPSLSESFGLGLAESIAAGCPIAAADLPYAHEVCGGAATYFDPNSSESIADVVLQVCSDEATLDRLRRQAQERKEFFSYKTIATSINRILEMSRLDFTVPESNWS